MSRPEHPGARNDEQALSANSEAQEKINTPLPSFESIEEKLGERAAIKSLHSAFSTYIETKLEQGENDFSDKEENTIKIVIWGEFQKLYSSQGEVGIFLNSVGHKIQSSLAPLTQIVDGEDSNEQQTLMNRIKIAGKFFEGYKDKPESNLNVLAYLNNKIGSQIDVLAKNKAENPEADFTRASKIIETLGGKEVGGEDKTNNEIFQEILKGTEELGSSLENKTKLGHRLIDTIDSLPNGISEFIKKHLSSLPDFLKSLFSMILGGNIFDEFLSGKSKKRKDSFNSLIALSQKNNSPISGIFPREFKENFDIKNLETFFKYLEEKEIDHTKENFWKELMTGKTEDENIKNLSDTLKGEYGEKILDGDDSKNNGEGLIKKLNNLPKIITERKNEKEDAELEASIAALPPIPLDGDTFSSKPSYTAFDSSLEGIPGHPGEEVSEDIPKVEISKEALIKEYTNNRNGIIKKALRNPTDFPMNIDYGELTNSFDQLGIEPIKVIDFQGDKLILGDNQYTISINDFRYMGVKIDDAKIIGNEGIQNEELIFSLRSEKHNETKQGPLTKKDLQEAILSVLINNEYKGKIKGNIFVPDIHYTIEKSSGNA